MVNIVMSALGPTLTEQCEQQGLVATGTNLEMSDRLAHAVTLLHVRGALTDSEANKARKRILAGMRLRQVRAAISGQKPAEGERG